MSNSANEPTYGFADTSFKAAGGEEGLKKLSRDFYEIMDQIPESKEIREMHTESLELMTEKLTSFLSMWLGGPKTYREKYSPLGMPKAHQHLIIDENRKAAWLLCMDQAIDKQPFSTSFKDYLKTQFRFPAEMIRKTSRNE